MTQAYDTTREAAWGVDELTVRYGHRTALEAVSLDVQPGAVTCVVGGDGAGKTTLLRAVAGAVRPQSGRVRRPALRDIGFISGSTGLYADLTVDENVAFVAAAYGLGTAERERRTGELLARTGVTGVGDRLAGRLSGGMRQKLAFALAMLHEPRLLILDEPTTGVDPVSRSEVWRLIAAAAAGGAAVLVATTYLDEAERAAQVLVLDAGRAVAAGPPEAVAAALPRPAARASAKSRAKPASQAALGLTPLAETRRVTRRFGEFTAVDAAALAVRPGEVVGLLGANGAGKTTLIRMLLGLLRPTSGVTLLFGEPPSRAARRRLGYVPQGLGLWDDMSVEENLAFASAAFDASPPPLDAELEAARGVLVRDLSLGLKRRLAFVAALAHSPELLVLDEPTSGVDARARARLWDTVHETASGGAGVLVTTHYLEEAGECDRLVFMTRGRVVADGTVASIVSDRRAVQVPLEGTDWAAAFAALDDAGLAAALHGRWLRVPVEGAPDEAVARVRAALGARQITAQLRLVPASLEEAFIQLSRGKREEEDVNATSASERAAVVMNDADEKADEKGRALARDVDGPSGDRRTDDREGTGDARP